jgi:hypothetical protein
VLVRYYYDDLTNNGQLTLVPDHMPPESLRHDLKPRMMYYVLDNPDITTVLTDHERKACCPEVRAEYPSPAGIHRLVSVRVQTQIQRWLEVES